MAHGLDNSLTPEAGVVAAILAWAFGASTLAVIHHGSPAQRRRTGRASACDVFVITSDHIQAFRPLTPTAGLHGTPCVARGLARVLQPKVVSLHRRADDAARPAKIGVVSGRGFLHEMSAHERNRFSGAALAQALFGDIRLEGADH